MTPVYAATLSAILCLLSATAASAVDADPAKPAHHLRRKPAALGASTRRVPDPASAATPMVEVPDRPETAADRAASLERRRKAFFAAPPAETGTSPPADVTLGGGARLTPGIGWTF